MKVHADTMDRSSKIKEDPVPLKRGAVLIFGQKFPGSSEPWDRSGE
jgi:hypothetical protein